MTINIFLSAVSSEFHERDARNPLRFASYRDILANALRRMGPDYVVITQEDLAQGFGDLLETLDGEIEKSDIVVHLIGNMAGYVCEEASVRRLRERHSALLQHEPELAASLQGVSNVTYTQWEIYLAFEHRCRRLVFLADDHTPRSPMYDARGMEESQELHLARLKRSGEHRERFEDQRDLALKVVTSIVRFGLGSAAVCGELSQEALTVARRDPAGLVHAIADGISKPRNALSADIDPVGVDAFLKAIDTASLQRELDRRSALEIVNEYREELRNAVTARPTAENLRELAVAELAMGDYARAMAMAQRCVTLAEQQILDDSLHAERHREMVLNGYLLLHDAANAARRRNDARAALEIACQFIDKSEDPIRWADCNEQLAEYLLDHAQIDRAEELIDEITDIREEHESETTELADSLLLWCRLLFAKAKHAEVIGVAARAEQIFRSQIPPDLNEVAAALQNRAYALYQLGRPAEAEPFCRRALTMVEQSSAANHPNVGAVINNLVLLLQDTNRLAEAEPLMRRALVIAEQWYGTDHPNVAVALNNLAALLKDTNRLAAAEPLIRRALAIDEQSYGPDHPHVALSYNNLALLFQATNRLAEAEAFCRRALTIVEQSSATDHPNVAVTLNNLVLLLQDTGRLAEAEPLMYRTAAILNRFQQTTGHEHPSMQEDLENFRRLLSDLDISPDEMERRLTSAMETTGPLEPIEPKVERLLGPTQPVADVLAELDEQYKVEDKSDVWFLPLSEPFAPHLDELLGPAGE